MTITIKDLIYLLTYIISIITLFLSFKNNLENLSKQIRLLNNIIFGDKGSLNLIDQTTCKAHRDQIWLRVRQNEAATNMLLQKIEELNRNVLAIMITLNVKKPEMPVAHEK